jgi:hypothetical protein
VCRLRVMAPPVGPISAQSNFQANGLVFGGKVSEDLSLLGLSLLSERLAASPDMGIPISPLRLSKLLAPEYH